MVAQSDERLANRISPKRVFNVGVVRRRICVSYAWMNKLSYLNELAESAHY